MNFFSSMRTWFVWVTQVLVNAALYCYNFGWPLEGLGDFFNSLSDWTAEVAGDLYVAANWWEDVEEAMAEFFSAGYWLDLWQSWYDRLVDVWEWFVDRVTGVLSIVYDWWLYTYGEVQEWVESRVQDFTDMLASWTGFWGSLWPNFYNSMLNLEATWSNFWTNTLPGLFDITKLESWWTGKLGDVQLIITGQLEELFPFYNDLAELWSDPEEWLVNRGEAVISVFSRVLARLI